MNQITYISPYFWPEKIGSAPYCFEVAMALKKAGHDVTVYAFRPHYPSMDEFEDWHKGNRDEEIIDGLLVRRVPTSARGRGRFLERLRNDIRLFWRIVRAAASDEVDGTNVVVAYVPSILSAIGGAVVAKLRRARLVVVVHDIESGLAESLEIVRSKVLLVLLRSLERVAFNRADQIVVLTKGMAEILREIGCRKPIEILPIWSDVFPEGSGVRQLPRIRVGYSGNFGKKQNIQQLIPLLKFLSERRPDIEVILRGDGSEKERIRSQVEELKLLNVRFENLVPIAELVDMIQEIDVHIVPQALNVARYALPSKIVSIMAAGRPFICIAEEGSPLERIGKESGAGVCVHPGKDESLYNAVVELVNDRDRRKEMAEAGRQYVNSVMNRDVILREYIRATENKAACLRTCEIGGDV